MTLPDTTRMELADKLLAKTHQDWLALIRALDGGPKPRCHDCADEPGICPTDKLPCDPQERALAQIAALRQPIASDAGAAKALLILAEYGVEPDVQELLVYGNPSRGIRPGALQAVLSTSAGAGTKVDQKETPLTKHKSTQNI